MRPNTGLDIFPGITLLLSNNPPSGFANYGTIFNNGTISMQSSFTQYGILDNYGLVLSNATDGSQIDSIFMAGGGTINNYGTFNIVRDHPNLSNSTNGTTIDSFNQTLFAGSNFNNNAIFNNYGILNNSGVFQNFEAGSSFNSTINNYGILENGPAAIFQNEHTIVNNGSVINAGSFTNNGTVVNLCKGNFEELSGGNFVGNMVLGVCGTTTTDVQVTTAEESSSG
jgi:hypothetical protein